MESKLWRTGPWIQSVEDGTETLAGPCGRQTWPQWCCLQSRVEDWSQSDTEVGWYKRKFEVWVQPIEAKPWRWIEVGILSHEWPAAPHCATHCCSNQANLDLVCGHSQVSEICWRHSEANHRTSEVMGVRQSLGSNCGSADSAQPRSCQFIWRPRTFEIQRLRWQIVQACLQLVEAPGLVICQAVYCPSGLLFCNLGWLSRRSSGLPAMLVSQSSLISNQLIINDKLMLNHSHSHLAKD